MASGAPRKGREVAVNGTAGETVGSAAASVATRGFAKTTSGDCAKTMPANASPTEIRITLSPSNARRYATACSPASVANFNRRAGVSIFRRLAEIHRRISAGGASTNMLKMPVPSDPVNSLTLPAV